MIRVTHRARACLAVQSVPARQFGFTFQSRFAPLSGSDRGRVERRLQSMTASILRVQRWCAAAGQRNTFRADPIGQLHHPDIHLEPIAHLVLARKKTGQLAGNGYRQSSAKSSKAAAGSPLASPWPNLASQAAAFAAGAAHAFNLPQTWRRKAPAVRIQSPSGSSTLPFR
jgi:hypothetical protein